jgi:hypothetical protein
MRDVIDELVTTAFGVAILAIPIYIWFDEIKVALLWVTGSAE